MAPVAGFVPELISNVLKSPFLRKGNKTPRRGSTTDEATPSSSEPQAGSPDAAAAVLQSSPRVATLDNQALSASVEVGFPSISHVGRPHSCLLTCRALKSLPSRHRPAYVRMFYVEDGT